MWGRRDEEGAGGLGFGQRTAVDLTDVTRTSQEAPKPVMGSWLKPTIRLCSVSHPGTQHTPVASPWSPVDSGQVPASASTDGKGDVGILAGKRQAPIKASMRRPRVPGTPI